MHSCRIREKKNSLQEKNRDSEKVSPLKESLDSWDNGERVSSSAITEMQMIGQKSALELQFKPLSIFMGKDVFIVDFLLQKSMLHAAPRRSSHRSI